MRTVFCEDAIVWLETQKILKGCSLVSSLPDFSEFQTFSLLQWREWFIQTVKLILASTPDDGVTIFFQTDVKHKGVWIDKSYLCQKAAEELSHSLIFHKIFCRIPAGVATFGRPSYSHLLCFAKEIKPDNTKAGIDVITSTGEKVWQRGMGLDVCTMIAKFIAEHTTSQTIVNPFCGQGSMLAVANALGIAAIGIEKSPKRSKKARLLRVAADGKSWMLENLKN